MSSDPLPSPGLGTSGATDEECATAVERALERGYRHVDTAQMYDNEAAVGEGIEAAGVLASGASEGSSELRSDGVDREDVFVATKVHHENLAPDDVRETVRESLDRLGLEYVDLLYVHWPMAAYDPERTLPAFDELREEGLIRHVGVANFTPDLLAEAREVLDSPLFAHQVECHPWLQQDRLRAEARERDHHLVAYSPVMKGCADEEPVLVDIADARGATPHQISLAWLRSLENVVPIPKGTGDHVDENWRAREIDLTDDERERIESIDREERLIDPDDAAWNR